MIDLKTLFCVGGGSFWGGILRYLLSVFIKERCERGINFPLSILLINLLGCFLMGYLGGVLSQKGYDELWSKFALVGFLGGFTTFSTFSMDSLQIIDKQGFVVFLVYVSLSVFGGLMLCGAGLWFSKIKII